MACWEHWTPLFPIGFFFLLPFLIYWDAIWCGWVSDDCTMSDGQIKPISAYEGKLQQPLSWHNLFKKVRYEFGKFPNPNPSWKQQKQPAFLPSPKAHHRLNIWFLSGSAGFLYSFLCRLTSAKIAFLTTLLFIVHPLGCQTVAWVSGIGYVVSLFFMLAGFNVGFLFQDGWFGWTPLGVLVGISLYGFFQWMAVEAQFATVGAFTILLWLHWWPMAIVAGVLGLYQCFHTFKEAISLRRKIFHEQQMATSTYFYLRKLVVMVKTIAYDVKLAIFPKRLGLYHTFNYHYPMPYVESEDGYFWAGILLLVGLGTGILFGPPILQLALLWFLTYIILFSNAITANQFVVDRYVWIPSLGICLLAALYLPVWAFWCLFGVALMRTWTHIPTYLNEIQFYLSNVWNFPSSEVALGNLGVVQLSRGMVGSAVDTWAIGAQLNPEYDVNWYNLASAFRSRGPLNPNYSPLAYNLLPPQVLEVSLNQDPTRNHLHVAYYMLQRAVNARTCHFPEPWKKELEIMAQELRRPPGQVALPAKLVRPMLTSALT